MPANINFFDNYIMMAIAGEIVPEPSFFRDRYFATGEGDIFAADKVLTEYKKGDRKIACFVSPLVGDIPVGREGYEIHEFQPAYIAPSRLLTLDDLKKRGFGEAMYPGSTPAERAAKLQLSDLTDLNRRIARREEWMAAQVMINNACEIQEYIDANTVGETKYVRFYDNVSEHTYTVANKWDGANGNVFADVGAMADMLSYRGLPAVDLLLGADTASKLLQDDKFQKALDRNSGIIIGEIRQELSKYPGVVYMGSLNFGGHILNVIRVNETYEDENGVIQKYFPAKAAMVTAPGCGHMMYGQITQIDFGSSDFTTYAADRVTKLVVDQPNNVRKIVLGSRPLAAPKNYCPYIIAANVVD